MEDGMSCNTLKTHRDSCADETVPRSTDALFRDVLDWPNQVGSDRGSVWERWKFVPWGRSGTCGVIVEVAEVAL